MVLNKSSLGAKRLFFSDSPSNSVWQCGVHLFWCPLSRGFYGHSKLTNFWAFWHFWSFLKSLSSLIEGGGKLIKFFSNISGNREGFFYFFFAIKRELNSKLEKNLINFPPPSIREESDFKNDQKCQNAQKLVNFEWP